MPPNRSATLSVTPKELTWSQQLRTSWNDKLPRTLEVNSLFIPTGRHQVRLDWRHRLAIPFVAMIVVLSPLLLIWAALVWVADKAAASRSARTKQGSDGG